MGVLSITADDQQPLVTVAQLARHVGVPGTQSPELSDCVRQASRIAEAYCRTRFRSITYAESWFDQPCVTAPYDIDLQRFPVVAIVDVLDADAATVSAADYELIDPAQGVLRFFESDPFSLDSDRWRLTVNYTAGFATIPDDLQRAVLDLGQKLFREIGSTEGSVESESLGDWSATYGKSFIPQSARAVLDHYQVVHLG